MGWLLARLARTHKLTNEEKEQVVDAVKHRRIGSVEVLVQSGWVAWNLNQETSSFERLTMLPLFLERGTASCLRAAVDAALPGLAPKVLFDSAEHVSFQWHIFAMDSAASNVRMFEDLVDEAPPNVFCLSFRCLWHQIVRPLVVMMETHQCLGPIYALNCLLRQTDYHYQFVCALAEIVQSELEIVYSPTEPDPSWGQYSTAMLQNTLLRIVQKSRARSHPSLPQPPPPAYSEKAIRPHAENFQRYVNGNLALPWVQHYCNGQCCQTRTRQESVRNVVDAIVRPLTVLLPGKPAGNKHGPLSENISHNAFGFEVHGILNRAFTRAFSVHREPEVDANNVLAAGEFTISQQSILCLRLFQSINTVVVLLGKASVRLCLPQSIREAMAKLKTFIKLTPDGSTLRFDIWKTKTPDTSCHC